MFLTTGGDYNSTSNVSYPGVAIYHKGMDITEVVVKTLNARYPSAKPTAAAPTPGTGVTPVGGTSQK